MEKTYTTSPGYKIFYVLIGVAIGGGSIILPAMADGGFAGKPALLLVPLIGIAFAVGIILNMIKQKVILSADDITLVGLFNTKSLANADINGFRAGYKNTIVIEPTSSALTKLNISYSDLADSADLLEEIRQKYTDLDGEEYAKEKDQILHDSTLGATEQDRVQLMNKTKKYTGIYTGAGTALLFIALFLPVITTNFTPFWTEVIAALLLVYPIAGIVMMHYSKGLIKLFTGKNSAYSSIFGGILFPAIGLILMAINGATLISYDKVWMPAAVVAAIMFFGLYVLAIKRTEATVLSQIFFVLLIAAAYGFGSILEVNCGFDTAQPKQFTAVIEDHYITHGKSTHYHVTIGDCGAFDGAENMDVSSGFYDDEPIGTKVNVYLKPGTLGIPWFYMTR